MDTVKPGLLADPALDLPWLPHLTDAIREIETDACVAHLSRAVGAVVTAEVITVLVYRIGATPIHVYDTMINNRQRRGLQNFVDATYVLNPVHIAVQNGLKDGVYRVSDLAPDEYLRSGHYRSLYVTLTSSEPLGYVTDDWPRGMDELSLIIGLPDGEAAEISLIRSISGQEGFTDADIRALQAIAAILSATWLGYWRLAHRRKLRRSGVGSKEQALADFGGEILSPRERDVARLILQGHSGLSIADRLGISITTVKTHRKNIYSKLGIATQYELFSQFLKGL